MREGGKVIWLKARPETILARMSGDATTAARRPSLTDKDPLDEVIHVLESRTSIYHQSAHLAIDTEGKTPEALATEILAQLELDA